MLEQLDKPQAKASAVRFCPKRQGERRPQAGRRGQAHLYIGIAYIEKNGILGHSSVGFCVRRRAVALRRERKLYLFQAKDKISINQSRNSGQGAPWLLSK